MGFLTVRIVGNRNEFITGRIFITLDALLMEMPLSRPIPMPKIKVIDPTVQPSEGAIHKLSNGTVGNIYGSLKDTPRLRGLTKIVQEISWKQFCEDVWLHVTSPV